MKTNKSIIKTNKIVIDNRPTIKIQLDYRTTITIRSIDPYKVWKNKYPEAILIEQLE